MDEERILNEEVGQDQIEAEKTEEERERRTKAETVSEKTTGEKERQKQIMKKVYCVHMEVLPAITVSDIKLSLALKFDDRFG